MQPRKAPTIATIDRNFNIGKAISFLKAMMKVSYKTNVIEVIAIPITVNWITELFELTTNTLTG